MHIIDFEINGNCLVADVTQCEPIKKIFIPKSKILSIEFDGKARLFIRLEKEYVSFDGKDDMETESTINTLQNWLVE